MQKQLCIDLDRNLAVNADGVQLAARPVLVLGEQPEYRVTFGRMAAGQDGESAFTPEDLSDVAGWRLSVDKDFSRTSAPMCRCVMADGIDVSGAGNGVIVFPVDTRTESFLAAVDGKEYLNCFLQVVGWNANGKQVVCVRLPWSAWGNIDFDETLAVVPQGALPAITPLTAVSGTVTLPALHGAVYAYTLTGNETIALGTAPAGQAATFELWLTQPATAVAVAFPAGVYWGIDNNFASGNPPPAFDAGGRTYCITFRWDGTRYLANLNYVVAGGAA